MRLLCVSIRAPSTSDPSFLHVCLHLWSFLHLQLSTVRFLGWAHASCKTQPVSSTLSGFCTEHMKWCKLAAQWELNKYKLLYPHPSGPGRILSLCSYSNQIRNCPLSKACKYELRLTWGATTTNREQCWEGEVVEEAGQVLIILDKSFRTLYASWVSLNPLFPNLL
jgi:hypothetical protein